MIGIWTVLALALVVAGCVTDGPRDIGGQTMNFSQYKAIDRSESRVQFAGDMAPRIEKTELAWRDNSMRRERLVFASPARGSVYVEFAETFYNHRGTEYIRNPAATLDVAKSICGTKPATPSSGRNKNGNLVYATCDIDGNYRCMAAVQGLGMKSESGESGYEAIAYFRYCARGEGDDAMLARLGTLRLAD